MNRTCLHILLTWNTGDKAISLFQLLVENGGKYIRDNKGFFPWHKISSTWITPIEFIKLGERNHLEFEETLTILPTMYKQTISASISL